jgi:hypothetical protein
VNEQPEALRLFTHQLLDCDGKPNGLHIGCDDLAICKESYVKGETSSAIHEWVDAAELRRLHAENEMLWKEREEPHQKVAMYVRECNRLEDERDELRKVNAELLEALKSARPYVSAALAETALVDAYHAERQVDIAIAKAEGEAK